MRQNTFGDWYYGPEDDFSTDPNIAQLDWDGVGEPPFYASIDDEDDGFGAEILDNESGEPLCYLEGFSNRLDIISYIEGTYPSITISNP